MKIPNKPFKYGYTVLTFLSIIYLAAVYMNIKEPELSKEQVTALGFVILALWPIFEYMKKHYTNSE